MTRLTKATARAAVDAWPASVSAGWSAPNKDKAADWLIRICEQVTPYIVIDEPLNDDALQHFLLARTIRRLEDWLIGAAATLRAGYSLHGTRWTSTGAMALGLRSASDTDLDSLPGVDAATATRISRYLAQHPDETNIDTLIDVDGIGPAKLAQIKTSSYLERPRIGLLSPTVWSFLVEPTIEEFLAVLAHTDLLLWFGDTNSATRQVPAGTDKAATRFLAFMAFVHGQASRTSSIADAVTTRQAQQWLSRQQKRRDLLDASQAATGTILVDGDYFNAAKTLIDGAVVEANLMMFLGTATAGDTTSPGPLGLVEAMEAAATRGVRVRVLLDQDDGGEPYRSFFINRPLAKRLAACGIDVKFDDEDTLLHSKVLIIDDVAVVVGSHNWTGTGLSATHEISVLLRSPEIARNLRVRFTNLWDGLPDTPPDPVSTQATPEPGTVAWSQVDE